MDNPSTVKPAIGTQAPPSGPGAGSLLRVRRAVLSVSDKSGIVDLARRLADHGVEIISTGGTLKTLTAEGIPVTSVSDVTGFPEILGGRVKTVHPAIHAGILSIPGNPDHVRQLEDQQIRRIELVVVNLYPFEQTIQKPETTLEDAIEQIDIGGPSMIRAAAKNYQNTAVVVDTSDYAMLLSDLQQNDGALTLALRSRLARKAFQHTAHYDTIIADYLGRISEDNTLPPVLTLSERKAMQLRYGENPHQAGALYGSFQNFFEKLHGKELSFNNILDIQAAVRLCSEFERPTAVVVKHNNPCGVGSADSLADAYRRALATDPTSSFGGIVAVNRPLDEETAGELNKIFLEVIVAPEFPQKVMDLLTKKRDRRLIRQTAPLGSNRALDVRSIVGGLLVQEQDADTVTKDSVRVVTKRQPSPEEFEALMYGWRVAKHVKSNAIVYAGQDRTLGIGAGQMSRVDASRIAAMKAADAGLDLHGSVVASDAFFPFADGLLEAVKVGATAAIQPGGSIRDEEVIHAADDHNIAMVFTGIRHFRH